MRVDIDDNGIVRCDGHVCTSFKDFDCSCGECPLWRVAELMVKDSTEVMFGLVTDHIDFH